MKKFCLFFLLFLVISCNITEINDLNPTIDDTVSLVITKGSNFISEYQVKTEDVKDYIHYLNLLKNREQQGSVTDCSPVVKNGRTVYYIINFEDGWRLLSADKRGPMVLAQNPNGHFLEDMQNSPVMTWIGLLVEDIEYRWDNPEEYYAHISQEAKEKEDYSLTTWKYINADSDLVMSHITPNDSLPGFIPDGHYELISTYQTTELNNQVNHLMSTQWHQLHPYNEFCPIIEYIDEYHLLWRYYAGCTIIAGAQVLYYLHHRFGFPATSPTYGSCVGYTINDMYFNNYTSSAWGLMASDENYIAMLVGDLAKRSNANFEIDGTSCSLQDLKNGGLLFYNVDCDFLNSYNSSIVYDNLINEKPVIFSGNLDENEYQGTSIPGHTFVIDGYRDSVVVNHFVYEWVYDYQGPAIILPTMPYLETTTNYSPFLTNFKLNWGENTAGEANNIWVSTDGCWALDTIAYSSKRKMLYNFTQMQ